MFGLRKLDTPYSRCVWRGWGVWLRLVRGVYFSGVSNAGLVQTIVQTTQQSNQQKYNNDVQPGHLVALRHHVCPPLPLEWRSRDLAHPIATKRELEETADAEKVGSFLFANILQRCCLQSQRQLLFEHHLHHLPFCARQLPCRARPAAAQQQEHQQQEQQQHLVVSLNSLAAVVLLNSLALVVSLRTGGGGDSFRRTESFLTRAEREVVDVVLVVISLVSLNSLAVVRRGVPPN
jgi:hypothetical protein